MTYHLASFGIGFVFGCAVTIACFAIVSTVILLEKRSREEEEYDFSEFELVDLEALEEWHYQELQKIHSAMHEKKQSDQPGIGKVIDTNG